jgi:hypothetical protein
MRRFILLASVPLAAAAGILLAAVPASADTDVVVTTTGDVVNVKDGVTSLREAITAANTAGRATTIHLALDATYTLTRCGRLPEDDTNLGGDLDHTTAQPLTVEGNDSTVEQTCAGERVLDLTDEDGTTTIDDLTVTGGDEADGAGVRYSGDLTVHHLTAVGNDAGTGRVIGSGPATISALVMEDSTIGPNVGTGVHNDHGQAYVSGSVVAQNTGRGIRTVDAHLEVADSFVNYNDLGGVTATGVGKGLFTVTGTTVKGNDGAGIDCSYCGSLEVSDSVVQQNTPGASSDGGGIQVTMMLGIFDNDLYVTVTNTTVQSNTRDGDGGGIGVRIATQDRRSPRPQVTVAASTVASNGMAQFAYDRGGGVYADTGTDLHVDNSTLTGNFGRGSGGAIHGDHVFLRHATVHGNFGPVAANIHTTGDLDSFASVVALGTQTADECVIGGATDSGGYNVGGDGSCGFAGVGDQNAVGDAELLSLNDNGGPTRTALPEAGSPVLGAVPAAACTELTVDQRGVSRPQGDDCEAGAVEVDE